MLNDAVHTMQYGEAVVKVDSLIRARELAFNRGYNKGLIVGAVATVVALKAYSYVRENRVRAFGFKQ